MAPGKHGDRSIEAHFVLFRYRKWNRFSCNIQILLCGDKRWVIYQLPVLNNFLIQRFKYRSCLAVIGQIMSCKLATRSENLVASTANWIEFHSNFLSLFHLFNHLFVHSFVCLFVHSFVSLFIHLFICSLNKIIYPHRNVALMCTWNSEKYLLTGSEIATSWSPMRLKIECWRPEFQG